MGKYEVSIRGVAVRIRFTESDIGGGQVAISGNIKDGDELLQSCAYAVDNVPCQVSEARNTIFEDLKKLAKSRR